MALVTSGIILASDSFVSLCVAFAYRFHGSDRPSVGKGSTVTFLVRNASCFDNDEDIQAFVKRGKARIVKGDALVKEDVRRGWEIAGQAVPGSPPELDGQVDVLLFTVGEWQRFF